MANLPITRDSSPTSGNSTNTLQPNTSVDDKAARGSSQRTGEASLGASAPSKTPSNSPDMSGPQWGSIEPFSELLARQISKPDSQAAIADQSILAVDGNGAAGDTGLTAKEAQDQAAPASASGDTAGILTAILLQIPASADRVQRTEEPGGSLQPRKSGKAIETYSTNASADAYNMLASMLLSQNPATDKRILETDENSSSPTTKGSDKVTQLAITNVSVDTASMLTQDNTLMEGMQKTLRGNSPLLTTGFGEVRQVKADSLHRTADKLPPTDNQFTTADHKQQTSPVASIPLSAKFIEHAEMVANTASPTPDSTNFAQAATPSAPPAVLASTLNSNTADTRLTITAPFGSNGWVEEFTQKINWMSTQQNQVAELHLSPPELGPLDVVLKITGNQATVLFTSPHGAVREAVENALPKLREIFADNGIMLGNATVSDQPPRDRSAGGHLNQEFSSVAQRAIFDELSNKTGLSPAISQNVPARRHNGMVDTFA